jgi:DNA-binding HxlR family transcriptional regulator
MVPTHYNCPCLESCPLHYAMSTIGGKWKMQIICTLNSSGPMRYNALKKRLDGISNTVLASTLRELERDRLVIRHEYLEVPVRVEYETSPECDELVPILDSLSDWAEKHAKNTAGEN